MQTYSFIVSVQGDDDEDEDVDVQDFTEELRSTIVSNWEVQKELSNIGSYLDVHVGPAELAFKTD